ncbi:protein JOKA2-like isoform X2 [Henckelia pumila]|uniref:protein JOKA2-like isoform X2 n=1 Tax=Henckelia pumila TaxID=405737 RepID=UPI003C6E1C26
MEASSALVIKARYGDILSRFHVKVVDLTMGRLMEKIFSLFKFAADTSIMLTYVDEDGDSVALVDDDDLNDVAKQSLNPLRIAVKLNAEMTGALPLSMWMPLEQF